MKLIIFSTLMALSLNVFAGVCCNSGGQPVPSMSLCPGADNVDGSPCCNRAGNQPGGNQQQPITWSTSNSCREVGNSGGSAGGSGSSNQNCCENQATQLVPVNCQQLGAELIATLPYGTDVVNRCNQINSSQSCIWKCGQNLGVGGNKIRKKRK